jgi:hypothetical protein
MTTAGDLLANRWQTPVRSPPGMQEAGHRTRPELLVCGGAPRRNRTGDPILTMANGALVLTLSESGEPQEIANIRR